MAPYDPNSPATILWPGTLVLPGLAPVYFLGPGPKISPHHLFTLFEVPHSSSWTVLCLLPGMPSLTSVCQTPTHPSKVSPKATSSTKPSLLSLAWINFSLLCWNKGCTQRPGFQQHVYLCWRLSLQQATDQEGWEVTSTTTQVHPSTHNSVGGWRMSTQLSHPGAGITLSSCPTSPPRDPLLIDSLTFTASIPPSPAGVSRTCLSNKQLGPNSHHRVCLTLSLCFPCISMVFIWCLCCSTGQQRPWVMTIKARGKMNQAPFVCLALFMYYYV